MNQEHTSQSYAVVDLIFLPWQLSSAQKPFEEASDPLVAFFLQEGVTSLSLESGSQDRTDEGLSVGDLESSCRDYSGGTDARWQILQ